MFGIPLTQILTFAVTYGPKVIQLLQVLGPVIHAAIQKYEEMAAAGVPPEKAAESVAGHINFFDTRSEASKLLDPTGGSFQGP